MNNMAFSNQGRAATQDCTFEAGSLLNTKIKVSYFLVILFIYQLIESAKHASKSLPLWFMLLLTTLNEVVLILTILCHEFGHGKMSVSLGGKIEQILLWPFGGICFSSRPETETHRKRLWNDMKIVCAGPATHFIQAPIWIGILVALRASLGAMSEDAPTWEYLIPFNFVNPCYSQVIDECAHNLFQYLLYVVLGQAISMNVMLFLFNVFFPMYPLDGAKIITVGLMLCGVSTTCAAWVLICMSMPLAIVFIVYAFAGYSGGSIMPGIMAYLGLMCLIETYRIYKLIREGNLHRHPLFEQSPSQGIIIEPTYNHRSEGASNTYRPASLPRTTVENSFVPFNETTGYRLDGGPNPGRGEFLDRLEEKQKRDNMSARELRETGKNANEI